jgi:hypothetical protein
LRTFSACYDPGPEDLADLSYHLDRTVLLDGFELDAFAAQRGLVPLAERIAS